MKFVRHHLLTAYAIAAFAYLLVPIGIVIAFSFNDPAGHYNYTWQGFTLDQWRNWNGVPGLTEAMWLSVKIAVVASVVATVLGTLIALALVRYGFRGRPGRTCSSSSRWRRPRSCSAPPCWLSSST
jgi:spermidine/putrescine transport system permease protein